MAKVHRNKGKWLALLYLLLLGWVLAIFVHSNGYANTLNQTLVSSGNRESLYRESRVHAWTTRSIEAVRLNESIEPIRKKNRLNGLDQRELNNKSMDEANVFWSSNKLLFNKKYFCLKVKKLLEEYYSAVPCNVLPSSASEIYFYVSEKYSCSNTIRVLNLCSWTAFRFCRQNHHN